MGCVALEVAEEYKSLYKGVGGVGCGTLSAGRVQVTVRGVGGVAL